MIGIMSNLFSLHSSYQNGYSSVCQEFSTCFYNNVKQFLFLFTREIAEYFSLGPFLDLLPLS
jgi:hypothetical protein